MIDTLREWFLPNILDKKFTYTINSYGNAERRYEYYNFLRKDIPFDKEFNEYLVTLTKDTNFTYQVYHIHKWKEGYFFNEHIDDRANRKFAYVCELKESECKTKLLVENKPLEEGYFGVTTKHRVPVIKSGERISLTVFGSNIIERKEVI